MADFGMEETPFPPSQRSMSWLTDGRNRCCCTAQRADRAQCGCAAECPVCARPSRHSASPAGACSCLALTEITIVVDFTNRACEVLKARRVSRGYLGWTAWMPHAHWYGVPSLSCMLVCFWPLAAISDPPNSCMPWKHWQFLPYLSPDSLPLIAAVRTRPFPSF